MNGYSYNELQNMQQKAIERVREMKRNSDAVVQTAQKELNMTEKHHVQQQKRVAQPKVTNMPPNFPQNNQYPSFKDFFEENTPKQEPHKTVKDARKENNSIESLFAEPDKALLLGLIMLLKSEGADESLIMALAYIMS